MITSQAPGSALFADAFGRGDSHLRPPSLGGRLPGPAARVYRNSDVYLNGKLLGNHPYAYTGKAASSGILKGHRAGTGAVSAW